MKRECLRPIAQRFLAAGALLLFLTGLAAAAAWPPQAPELAAPATATPLRPDAAALYRLTAAQRLVLAEAPAGEFVPELRLRRVVASRHAAAKKTDLDWRQLSLVGRGFPAAKLEGTKLRLARVSGGEVVLQTRGRDGKLWQLVVRPGKPGTPELAGKR